MLALLAAITVATASPAPIVEPIPGALSFNTIPAARFFAARPSHCKDAARLRTSGPEPALLYRNDGRSVARRLIDLPEAEMCLLATPAATGGAEVQAGGK